MGAGDFDAGFEDAGDDLVIVIPDPRVVPVVKALLLDVQTHDFPQDANGFYVGLHPVDARVEAKMAVSVGSIKAAPIVGNALRSVKYITGKTTTEVTYIVQDLLSDEVQAGNIEVESIDVQTATYGFAMELRYVNLRLAPNAQTTRTVKRQVHG